jgi:hypothetical protein
VHDCTGPRFASTAAGRDRGTAKLIDNTGDVRLSLWARQVLNLRPLACEASALPLSYAPEV